MEGSSTLVALSQTPINKDNNNYHPPSPSAGLTHTFLVGEWRTGAGGDGGPRGIFWLVLNFGGSMGSFCASTILMILCLEPELKATACVEGV